MNPNDPLFNLYEKIRRKSNKIDYAVQSEKKFGNILAIGNPGNGKTSYNRKVIETRYFLGHKIFCLYDGGTRMDMGYFMFPSVSKFWAVPKVEGKKIYHARSYPTELLYPVSSTIPHKIPKHGKIFTIAVSDITEEDLIAILGSGKTTDVAKVIFRHLAKKVTDNTTAVDYLEYLDGISKDKKMSMSHHGVKKLREFFASLNSQGLLSSKNAETALNIPEMIKDKRTISVLVLRHIPEAFWGFLVHFFMKHISNSLAGAGNARKVNQRTTISFNEVADLLDDDEEKGSANYAIGKMFAKIAKQSRTFDIFMVVDTQLPQELPAIKDTFKEVIVFQSSQSAWDKATEIAGFSSRTGEISSDHAALVGRLGKGYYFKLSRDEGLFFCRLMWTMSRTWEDGEDFYDVYDSVYGKMSYYDIRSILNKLHEENKFAENTWKKLDKKEKLTTKEMARIVS